MNSRLNKKKSIKFRHSFSEPLPPVYSPDQGIAPDGFVPGAVEPVGILISRIEGGGKVPGFMPDDDPGTGDIYYDEFDFYDDAALDPTIQSTQNTHSEQETEPVKDFEGNQDNGRVGETQS